VLNTFQDKRKKKDTRKMVDKDNKGIEVYLFDYGNYNMSYLKLSGNCYMLMLNRNQHERR
jgi:hypothetical protein